jgi:hypothetical protein
MSFYDDASIVLIPSGYKTSKLYSQKPTDGSGDLSFTRTGSTATRVNESGLIERCRTNQLLYSQDYTNGVYVTGGYGNLPTITANSIANPIDGVQNASTANFLAAGTQARLLQLKSSLPIGVTHTYSIYAKAGTKTSFVLYSETASIGISATFNLSSGVVTSPTNCTASIVALSNGWYRCIITSNIVASGNGQYGIVSGIGADGTLYLYGWQLEIGDIATDYISTTSAAVTVGPIANLPRLDYTGGGCPKLLMEPTRTNLITYSEQFNNAAWVKVSSTVLANQILSIDGYVNSDSIKINSAGGGVYQNVTAQNYSAGASYTFSIFIKSNLRALSWAGATPAGTNIYSIQDYGNGWYRQILTRTFTNAGTNATIQPLLSSDELIGTNLFYAYGAQLEAGSYATSYIQTFNASVTRNADSASKTGISSLIGQTEGTVFLEINTATLQSYTQRVFTLSDSTTNNIIGIQLNVFNELVFYVENGGVNQALIVKSAPAVTFGQNVKIAIAYKLNDFVFYVNGSQVGTDTSGTVPATSALRYAEANDTAPYIGKIAQTILFKTRLSNSDLATLTTL